MNVSEVAVDVPVPNHPDQSIPLWNVPRVGFIRDYDVLVVGAGFAGATSIATFGSRKARSILSAWSNAVSRRKCHSGAMRRSTRRAISPRI